VRHRQRDYGHVDPIPGFQVGVAFATKAGKIYGGAILKCKRLTWQNCYRFHREES